MAHFIPCTKTIDLVQLAYLLTKEVFTKHRLLESIVSDHGSLFTSHFWKALMKLMGIQVKMLTSFHPQTNRATERVNQTLKQYIRSFINFTQDDWADYIPLAEYTYTDSPGAASGYSPFYIVFREHPPPPPMVSHKPPTEVPTAA